MQDTTTASQWPPLHSHHGQEWTHPKVRHRIILQRHWSQARWGPGAGWRAILLGLLGLTLHKHSPNFPLPLCLPLITPLLVQCSAQPGEYLPSLVRGLRRLSPGWESGRERVSPASASGAGESKKVAPGALGVPHNPHGAGIMRASVCCFVSPVEQCDFKVFIKQTREHSHFSIRATESGTIAACPFSWPQPHNGHLSHFLSTPIGWPPHALVSSIKTLPDPTSTCIKINSKT